MRNILHAECCGQIVSQSIIEFNNLAEVVTIKKILLSNLPLQNKCSKRNQHYYFRGIRRTKGGRGLRCVRPMSWEFKDEILGCKEVRAWFLQDKWNHNYPIMGKMPGTFQKLGCALGVGVGRGAVWQNCSKCGIILVIIIIIWWKIYIPYINASNQKTLFIKN
jgi:hypothetical protein